MKNLIKVAIFSLTAVFIFIKCEEQLELSPLGELNSDTYYNTEEDFESASLAPYSTMLNLYYDQFGQGWFQGIMFPSDDVRDQGGGSNDQVDFNWLPNNGQFSYLWNESYKGIMRSNVILNQLPGADGFQDESNKPRFEAEAKYIRAYFYFILARNFGTPPVVDRLVESISDARIGNSQPGEVWDLIESDLQFAQENLPDTWNTENTGRATSFAATALLGKVKLFRAQWMNQSSKYSEAVTEFNKVVNSGQFKLIDNYGNNFDEGDENNAESVFEIQMTRGDFNTWLPNDFGLGGNQNIGYAGTGRKVFTAAACYQGECAPGANAYGYGQVHVTRSLQNEFEQGDPRIYNTFYQHGDMYSGEPYDSAWSVTGSTPAKYIRPFKAAGFPPNLSTNNERVIRYADVLLMLAEAELLGNNNVARAAELINRVRQRARNNYDDVNGSPAPAGLLPDRPSSASVDQMHEWLRHERRVELALEVHRYDDLVRWHRAGLINITTDIDFGKEASNNNWEEKHLLKPIPQAEIDVNSNLKQNPDY